MKNVKKEAQAFFKSQKYQHGIQSLLELGPDAFILFGVKNKWFSDSKLLKELILIQPTLLKEIFHSRYSDDLLHQYFHLKNLFCKEFEDFLSSVYPRSFKSHF